MITYCTKYLDTKKSSSPKRTAHKIYTTCKFFHVRCRGYSELLQLHVYAM